MSAKILTLGGGWTVEVAAASDVGCVRGNNEDSHGIFEGGNSDGIALLVVADGMGGAAAGEVASHLAVDTVKRSFFGSGDEAASVDRIRDAIREANRAVFERAAGDKDLSGMGTTITAAIVGEGSVRLGHIGDSRAYRVSGGSIELLTVDHTLAAELAKHHHPGTTVIPRDAHNILTRCLGVEREVFVDVSEDPVDMREGDVLLLCSDGLTNMVAEDEIRRTVAERPPEEACRHLVSRAREEGGLDNITVVVARFARG